MKFDQLLSNDHKAAANVHVSAYRLVLEERQKLYDSALSVGQYTPFLLPWDLLPAVFLILGVTVSPRLPAWLARACRYSLFILEAAYFSFRWSETRSLGMACGYGIGLASQWGAIMGVVLLLLHDPGKDFERLEVRPLTSSTKEPNSSSSSVNGQNGAVDIRNRKVYGMNNAARELSPSVDEQVTSKPYRFVWQSYPSEFWHVMDWSFDLVTSFRGLNWNFRDDVFPAPDIPLPERESREPSSSPHKFATSPYTAIPRKTLHQLRNQAARDFVFYYIYIDLLKTCMVTDPYFLGITALSSPTPWSWLARVTVVVPFATKLVRLCMSLAGVAAALTFVFSLSPLSFAVIIPTILGKDRLMAVTRSPLLEPWMYVPQWGSMLPALRLHGLGGMWGLWWHQMFRYGISEPARFFLKQWNIDSRSLSGRGIKLICAFGLSGAIHAAASSTTFSIIPSRPLNPLLFFFSQALGVAIQKGLAKWFTSRLRTSSIWKQAGNVSFVLIWLWLTGPLLADDFARCGIWLFEPVPFSIFRGLGYGPGDTWFPWLSPAKGGKWLGWWDGGVWYHQGLAVF